MWWDETIERWRSEGLPPELTEPFEIHDYFELDPYKQFWFSTTEATIEAKQHHVEGIVSNMDDYLRILPQLYPDHGQAPRGAGGGRKRGFCSRGRIGRVAKFLWSRNAVR